MQPHLVQLIPKGAPKDGAHKVPEAPKELPLQKFSSLKFKKFKKR